jgi:hypothetical protein
MALAHCRLVYGLGCHRLFAVSSLWRRASLFANTSANTLGLVTPPTHCVRESSSLAGAGFAGDWHRRHLGEYGTLGHSVHLPLGIAVVALVLASAWAAGRIAVERPWARKLHVALNGILGFALMGVGLSGWQVVQKYLP